MRKYKEKFYQEKWNQLRKFFKFAQTSKYEYRMHYCNLFCFLWNSTSLLDMLVRKFVWTKISTVLCVVQKFQMSKFCSKLNCSRSDELSLALLVPVEYLAIWTYRHTKDTQAFFSSDIICVYLNNTFLVI